MVHRLRGDQGKYDAMEVSVLVFSFWIFEIDRIIGLAGKCCPVDYFCTCSSAVWKREAKEKRKEEKEEYFREGR